MTHRHTEDAAEISMEADERDFYPGRGVTVTDNAGREVRCVIEGATSAGRNMIEVTLAHFRRPGEPRVALPGTIEYPAQGGMRKTIIQLIVILSVLALLCVCVAGMAPELTMGLLGLG